MINPHEPLTIRAAPERDLTVRTWSVRAETLDLEARSVEAVLSTEAPTAVFDMRRFEVIDEALLARGAEFDDSFVMLDDHMRFTTEFVIGSVRNVRVEQDRVIGRLFFAEGDERADRIWNKVRQGHLRDVSIGYRAIEFVDIPPNTKQRVAGREWQAGARTLRVTTRYRIREASVTPIGADAGAKIRSEAGLPPQSTAPARQPLERSMNPELRRYLESIGLRKEATDDEALAFWRSLGGDLRIRADGIADGTIKPGAPALTAPPADDPPATRGEPREIVAVATLQRHEVTDPADAARAAVTAERERVAAIRSHAAEHQAPESLVQRALDRGWSLQEYTERADELAEIRRNEQPDPAIDWAGGFAVRGFDRVASANALAAGLMARSGQAERIVGAEAAPEFYGPVRSRLTEQDAERGDRFATDSFVDLCRNALRVDGRQIPHNRDEMVRAAFSTPALTFAFSTSIHARMLASYMEAEDTSDWCSTEEVANFQTQERGSLGKTAGLDKLARGKTANHATISDSKEEYKIARYAKQFVVDEQDMADDNIGLIQQMPSEMGMAAARLRPDLVYSIFLANPSMRDSVALFHNDHGNTESDTFGKTNLEGAISLMMQQTEDGVRLNLRPRYLIVPGDLEFTARELLTSAQLIIAGTEDPSVVRGNRNVLTDLALQLRVEGRIDAAGVTDPNSGTAYTGSATTWFLAAAPGRTIVVGYRSGTGRRPQMRRFTLDRGTWGLGWDINLDIGVKALDWRGLYRGNT